MLQCVCSCGQVLCCVQVVRWLSFDVCACVLILSEEKKPQKVSSILRFKKFSSVLALCEWGFLRL